MLDYAAGDVVNPTVVRPNNNRIDIRNLEGPALGLPAPNCAKPTQIALPDNAACCIVL